MKKTPSRDAIPISLRVSSRKVVAVTVAEAAYSWQASGVATIPILANQTKRPVVSWKPYQSRLPLDGEMTEWWGNGHNYGLALIMGHVSGNLEMLELEAEAYQGSKLAEVYARMDELGVGRIWDYLQSEYGYSEESPSGGLHLIYHIEDHPVPGNEKIASAEDRKVLAETRGEGGYVIVAPSSGACHPSGQPWVLLSGQAGRVAAITWEQRNLIFQAIRDVLHYAEPAALSEGISAPLPAPVALQAVERGGAELRPGDDFENRVGWSWILARHGWQKGMVQSDGTTFWTRPGKDPRDGYSATTGHAGDRDRLYVFSTSTVFPTEEPITKFRAFSLLEHAGNDSAAASALANWGLGKAQPRQLPDFEFDHVIDKEECFDLSDQGNAERMTERVKGHFHWSEEERKYLRFDGKRWVTDHSHLYRAVVTMTKELTRSTDTKIAKFGLKSQSDASVEATKRAYRHQPGVTVSASSFNQRRELLNVDNGTLNLRTGEFTEHNPEHMITQLFNAKYDPDATCPKFDRWIEQLLPDAVTRAYVQRAIGSTMLGDAGSRAVFLVHGPSGTGKTQFLELFGHLFGSYANTAPASTFRAKREGAPPHDLHQLRGMRFIATSETSDSAQFDEEALKRITGGDSISSRDLYEGFQKWIPECNIWMATNFPPRFSSDDNAMWRRAKLIPFTTVFGEDPEAPVAIPNYARQELFAEADGILNWLLAGLADFLAAGLQEPEGIGEAAEQLRLDSDPVAQFAEDLIGDGQLTVGEGQRIRSMELHSMYMEWSKRNGLRTVSQRRFTNRLESAYPELTRLKSHGQMMFIGIGRSGATSIFGSFMINSSHEPD